MYIMLILLMFSQLLNGIAPLRILFYMNIFGKSHLDYADSLMNVLSERGHTVDLVLVRINDRVVGNGNNKADRVFSVEFPGPSLWGNLSHIVDPFKEVPFYYGDFRHWNSVGHAMCELSVHNEHLLSFIESEKYDVAVTSQFDFCALGVVSLFDIPSVITVTPCPISPLMSVLLGIPNPPSTTIPLFQPADLTTHFGRFWNVVNWAYIHYIQVPEIKRIQEGIFKRRFGDNFSLDKATSKVDISFVNSNEIMEKPRAINHHIQYIGGINMRSPKPLTEEIDRLLSRPSNGTVIFSFGTQVHGRVYPRYAVKNFVKAFKKFSDYTFLWKYEVQEGEEKMFEEATNVFPLDWLPQTDLLYDPRVVGFISHLGLNSFNEASYAGKPMVAIPLFADQPHNTENGVFRGTTVRLDKTKLTEESIVNGLRAILTDPSYLENAQMLSKMLSEKPAQPKDRFIEWLEFAARNPGLHKILELPEYINGYWLVQDSRRFDNFALVNFFNSIRSYTSDTLGLVSMYNLTHDVSLELLASKAMSSCDNNPIEDLKHRKIRLKLMEGETGPRFPFEWYMAQFYNHVQTNGTKFSNLPAVPDFQTISELLFADQKRIGCAFKTCTSGSDYRIFNLVCYLWPKKTLEGSMFEIGPNKCGGGLCKEKRREYGSERHFRDEMLVAMNSARRAFAKKAEAANMFKVSWDSKLADVAKEVALKCSRRFERTRTHTTIPMISLVSPDLLGDLIGSRYSKEGAAREKKQTRVWKETQFWWNHKEMGCARSKESCEVEVYCTFRHPASPTYRMYESGKLCSQCPDDCDDGLCFKNKSVMTSTGNRSKISMAVWILIFLYVLIFSSSFQI